MITQTLEVRLPGRLVGYLTNLPDDANVFTFAEEYAEDPQRPTLSLRYYGADGSLLREGGRDFRTRRLAPPFFSNLLPEAALRRLIAASANASTERDFPLLRLVGGDLPGAVELRSIEGEPPSGVGDAGTEDKLEFSLGGVQLKFSAVRDATGGLTIPAHGSGGHWIIKLPSFTFASVPDNEFSMLSLARASGIRVPDFELVKSDAIGGLPSGIDPGHEVLAVRRYDRVAGGRVHAEDLAQVFGKFTDEKYETVSYENVAEVLARSVGRDAVDDFLRRLVFSAAIGNGDAHLKNWSLIYGDGKTPTLAPAYDLVSTVAYVPADRLALSFGGSKQWDVLEPGRVESFARQTGLPEAPVRLTMQTAAEDIARAWKRLHKDLPLPGRLRPTIESHINTFLQTRKRPTRALDQTRGGADRSR
jgi:serine/threonine-protein kinase HipA